MRRGQAQSERARKRIRAWNEEHSGKAVLCPTTGTRYKTISSAARWLERSMGVKVRPIQISRVCHGDRQSCHGRTYQFIETRRAK
jgi:hypothetical protein